jgi:hypothetical protein
MGKKQKKNGSKWIYRLLFAAFFFAAITITI